MSDWMKKVVEDSGKKIAGSDIYCVIYTESFMKNPRCALELGLALLMNKPIRLLVQKGTPVGASLRKVADRIEEYIGPDDLKAATKRLLIDED